MDTTQASRYLFIFEFVNGSTPNGSNRHITTTALELVLRTRVHLTIYCSSNNHLLSQGLKSQSSISIDECVISLCPDWPLISEIYITVYDAVIIDIHRNQSIGLMLMCERGIPERELMCEQILLKGHIISERIIVWTTVLKQKDTIREGYSRHLCNSNERHTILTA